MQDTKPIKRVNYVRKKVKRLNTYYLIVKKRQKWRIDWDTLEKKTYSQRVCRIIGPRLNMRQLL